MVRFLQHPRPDLAIRPDRAPTGAGRLRLVSDGPAGQGRVAGRTRASALTLGLLTLVWAFSHTDRQLLGMVLPLVQADLHLSDTSIGLITGAAFVLFYSLLGLPIAWAADRSNRRNILAAGLVLWSVMTSLTGMAGNVWQLVACRFLVGAGEATGAAPATSLVSDLFDKADRPLAMAVLSASSSVAALLFLPVMGWIALAHGWRAAFMAAGYGGLALAVLFVLCCREPARQGIGAADRSPPADSVAATARFLLGSRAYLYTVAGGALIGVSLYASQVWHPSFLARVHHLNVAQVGAAIGVPRGVAGLAGALLGGLIAERLGRRRPLWRLAAPALACILAFPAELLFLFSPGLPLALTGMLAYHLLIGMQFGPVYAACQSIAPPRMRCMATAAFLLAANLTGQVIGPLAVGYLNDRWAAAFGPEAIRYSLLTGSVCVLLGGVVIALGARSLAGDTARAEAHGAYQD